MFHAWQNRTGITLIFEHEPKSVPFSTDETMFIFASNIIIIILYRKQYHLCVWTYIIINVLYRNQYHFFWPWQNGTQTRLGARVSINFPKLTLLPGKKTPGDYRVYWVYWDYWDYWVCCCSMAGDWLSYINFSVVCWCCFFYRDLVLLCSG